MWLQRAILAVSLLIVPHLAVAQETLRPEQVECLLGESSGTQVERICESETIVTVETVQRRGMTLAPSEEALAIHSAREALQLTPERRVDLSFVTSASLMLPGHSDPLPGGSFGLRADMRDASSPVLFGLQIEGQYGIVSSESRDPRVSTTLNARIGLNWDDLTTYVTGGTIVTPAISSAVQPLGWNIGFGTEYRLGTNWSAGVEYRYSEIDLRVRTGPGSPDRSENRNASAVTGNVTYRFLSF